MNYSSSETAIYISAVLLFAAAHVLLGAPFWTLYVALGTATVLVVAIQLHTRAKAGASLAEQRGHASQSAVIWDENGIMSSFDGKELDGVAWGDVIAIDICIVNDGFIDVPHWLVSGRSGYCVYPSHAVGSEGALEQFEKRLPGFYDRRTYIAISQAMAAMTGEFRVWKRGSPGTA